MEKSLLLVLMAVIIGVSGQLVLKAGMSQVGPVAVGDAKHLLRLATTVFTNPMVLAGLGLYVVGAVIWLTVLSRLALSFAYPMLALSYAFTPIGAWLVLGEGVPPVRWLGVAVIVLGVFLVSRTG